jgi:predicted RNA-binding protein Jag
MEKINYRVEIYEYRKREKETFCIITNDIMNRVSEKEIQRHRKCP